MILTAEQDRLIHELKDWYGRWYYGGRKGLHPQWYSYSGAAGTGKTTVIKELIKLLGLHSDEYISAAYVGKAVLNLQKHLLPAKTIHSLIFDIKFEMVRDSITGDKRIELVTRLKESLPDSYRLIIIDEATMVNDDFVEKILSFNLPVIFIGDKNQLPPIFGVSSIMLHPDFFLTQIMRQKEEDPIVQFSQMILRGEPLPFGKYGKSEVILSKNFNPKKILRYDQTLTTTNKARFELNKFVRYDIKGHTNNLPTLYDRIICRRNNWALDLNGFSLTNGLTGYIVDIDRSANYRGAFKIDFQPDIFQEGMEFEGLFIDAKHIQNNDPLIKPPMFNKFEIFEYAYAITVHLSQGSEYDNVLFYDSPIHNADLTKKARYTAITRAKKAITIVR